MSDNNLTAILNMFAQKQQIPDLQLALATFVGDGKMVSAISRGMTNAGVGKRWHAGTIMYVNPSVVENAKQPIELQCDPWNYVRFVQAVYNFDKPQTIKNAQQRTGIIATVDKKAVKYEDYPIVKLYNKLAKTDDIYFIEFIPPVFPNATETPKVKLTLGEDFPFPKVQVTFNTEYSEFDVISPNNHHMMSAESELNATFEKFLETYSCRTPKKNEDNGENG